MKKNFLALPKGQIHIWAVKTDGEAQAGHCGDVLDEEEQERLRRFRFEKDRRAFRLSHSALRFVLSRYLYCSPREIAYRKNEFGKPFISHPSTELHFNLSHSRAYALIALADCPVGVDIEYRHSDISMDLIAERFFEANEYRDYQQLTVQDKLFEFYHLWTKKEALAKALGLSIYHILDCQSVSLSCQKKSDEVNLKGNTECAGNWHVADLDWNNLFDASYSRNLNDYAAAVCFSDSQKKVCGFLYENFMAAFCGD